MPTKEPVAARPSKFSEKDRAQLLALARKMMASEGGLASAAKLTSQQRSARAKRAAAAREKKRAQGLIVGRYRVETAA
jgi:hypothetical protein